jgi:peptide/nickel transport system permease protein
LILSAALSRLTMAIVTLFGVACVVFVLLRVVPGDPVAMMIAPGARPADVLALRARYGLDLSLPMQFLVWLISIKRRVVELLAERLPATLELGLAALLLAMLTGGALAVVGTLWRARLGEILVDGGVGLLLAVPDFVWALGLVLLLGVILPVLPLSGRLDPGLGTRFHSPFFLFESLVTLRFTVAADILAHMAMPVLALALPLAAVIARVLKGALIEAMQQDYVLLGRVKGFSELRLVLREALRNALGPTLALTGVQFTFLLGGTIIVERIFGYPGLGTLAIDAVINRDLPLIQGLVLMFALLFILINLGVDLGVAALDPKLRHG